MIKRKKKTPLQGEPHCDGVQRFHAGVTVVAENPSL